MATLQTRLTNLAVRISTEAKALRTLVNGNAADLTALTTTVKTNLVAALNEVRSLAAGKQDALGFTPVNTTAVGAAGGVASLDGGGKVPSGQLPSFVDDIVEAANFAALPGTGETGKIYITVNDNKQFRWGGSSYVEMVSSPGTSDAITEGSVNLYHTGPRVVSAMSASLGDPDTDLVAEFNSGLL